MDVAYMNFESALKAEYPKLWYMQRVSASECQCKRPVEAMCLFLQVKNTMEERAFQRLTEGDFDYINQALLKAEDIWGPAPGY